ncbi:hypothetical protein T492DRAFT_847541 [Pavlovales sp. CCMP2436]|nr:hypothetical protein T492DRAFT_847541 [Pavlovales sp. CCMP2436]
MSVTKRPPPRESLASAEVKETAPLPPGAGASSSSSSGVTRSVGVLELRPTDDAVHDVGDGHALRVDVELATHDAPSARAAAGDGVLRAAHTRAGRLLWQRRAADAALRVDVAAHLALATVESLNSRGSGSDEAFYILTHFGYVALFGAAVPALPLLLLAHVLLGARAAATCALVFTQRAAPMGTDWLGGAHLADATILLTPPLPPIFLPRWLAVLSPLSTIALLLLSTPTLECFVAPADMLLAGVLPPARPWEVRAPFSNETDLAIIHFCPAFRLGQPASVGLARTRHQSMILQLGYGPGGWVHSPNSWAQTVAKLAVAKTDTRPCCAGPAARCAQDADMPWAVYGLCPAASRLSLVVVLLAVEHMLILARYACPCRTLFGHA